MVSVFSPARGAARVAARLQIRDMKAGAINRLTKNQQPRSKGVNPPIKESQVASARARSMFWSDPRVSKAQRYLGSRIIGCGMKPQSLAMTIKTSKPWPEFGALAEALWEAVQKQLCYEGRPGKGGQTVDGMAITNFNEMFISGVGLTRRVPLTPTRAASEGRLLPLAYTLYSSNQLVDQTMFGMAGLAMPDGHFLRRGFEFNAKNTIAAYHLYDRDPFDNDALATGSPVPQRWNADQIICTYMKDFPGLVRGETWISPSTQVLKDTDELIENDLQCGMAASCVMGTITQTVPTQFGLAAPTGGTNTQDNGQTIERMEPNLIAKLKVGEEFKGFSPTNNANDIDKTAGLTLRGAAAGIRGIKASTLTQDYERGSFSSETAADNDISFEHEMLQEFVGDHWYQNIWEDVIKAGIGVGWFDRLSSGGLVTDFRETLYRNFSKLTEAVWQGPVQKHLQPASAENASQVAVTIGTSNIPLACSERGYRWRNVADGQMDYLAYVMAEAKRKQIPEEMVLAFFKAQTKPEGRPAQRSDDSHVTNRLSGLFQTNGVH